MNSKHMTKAFCVLGTLAARVDTDTDRRSRGQLSRYEPAGSLRAQVTASSLDAILALLAVFVPSTSDIDATHARNEIHRYFSSILDSAQIRCSRARLLAETRQ
jgi:hypothetical protein